MATINLTEGAIMTMCNNDCEVNPVLQVTELRLVNTQNAMSTVERYRLIISDGVYSQQAMLATQHNALVKSGCLQQGSIIQILQFVCNTIQSRRIIIVVELEIVQEAYPLIGEPKQYLPPSPNDDIASPSVGQAGVVPGYAQHRTPYATGPGPTYRQSETGSLQQPKLEYGAPLNSYGRPSAINSDTGNYAINKGPPMYPKSDLPAGLTGSATGGSSYVGFNNARTDTSRAPPSTYARHQQPAYQQQPSMYMNRGPVAKNEAPSKIVPIAALNPYQGRWTIKARVTAKGELRHYNNPRGDGKVFSFDLLDSEGGEIRVTCFNAVVDQFYDMIEVGKVYLISKGTLKPAQKNFNHLSNDHELFLDTTSLVQPCYDDDGGIPRLQFHFRPISDIEGIDNQGVIDVIGVVTSISPTTSIMRKNGTETQKRSLQLKDMSGRSVELTMWGNFCNSEGQKLQNLCDTGNFPVLAVKAARVSDFNGKVLGTISSSQLFIEPDNPEAEELKVWFDQKGKNLPSVSISREMTSMGRTEARKTISQIKDEKLGTSEKPDWITVCATLSFIKMDNFCYTACPNLIGDRQCNKKVTNNGDGKWRCDRCDQSVDECDYRYILQVQIQDHTGSTWVTAFQECAEELLGMSAKDLFDLKYNSQDDDKFQEAIRATLFHKYIFKLKVKEETFSDEQRVKSTVVKAEKVNFVVESRSLFDSIHRVKSENMMSPSIGTKRSGFNQTGMHPNSTVRETGGYGLNKNTTQYGNQNSGGYGHNTNTTQYGNQYSGGYGGNSASGMHATCTSCGGTGHSSINCPSIINGPSQPSGPVVNQAVLGGSNTARCFKCQNVGHFAKDCPGLNNVPPAYGGGSGVSGRYGGAQRQHIGGY
ncbi:replication protein A 70 kDa DNA-binding subunit A-like [Silene latifolia]|uniref:replication protein A 70 kDa DNA-binding subunit A-like n=1 Tax=Silene latifolia TaxID=37657 RepID=UPI003D7836C4